MLYQLESIKACSTSTVESVHLISGLSKGSFNFWECVFEVNVRSLRLNLNMVFREKKDGEITLQSSLVNLIDNMSWILDNLPSLAFQYFQLYLLRIF